jgi:hypothetical protein
MNDRSSAASGPIRAIEVLLDRARRYLNEPTALAPELGLSRGLGSKGVLKFSVLCLQCTTKSCYLSVLYQPFTVYNVTEKK